MVAGGDPLASDGHARQAFGVGARRDDEVRGFYGPLAGAAFDRHPGGSLKASLAFDDLDLVLLHQELKALVELVDDLLLATVGSRPVELDPADHYSRFGAIARGAIEVGGVKQRLGGDAALV